MRATVIHAPYDVRSSEVEDPRLLTGTDAVVRVLLTCICGSDLWRYRGEDPIEQPRRIGHEFVGVVEEIGADVRDVAVGDLVIAPFAYSDGTCPMCRRGVQTSCAQGGFWANPDREGRPVDGAQGEAVRVPFADGTLVAVPGVASDATADPALLASLLTLSDVLPTGHHAALAARVGPGATVAVVGDGAVGLSAVLAAKLLGAERVVAMSRHESRQRLAVALGADDVVAARGEDGAAQVRELLGGVGPDCVLECVGTGDSVRQAVAVVRDGGRIGVVGLPHGVELPIREMFYRNVSWAGGVAPARAYIAELLPAVLERRIDPGQVFDVELPLAEVAEGYRLMDQRQATKVLLRP